MFLFFRKLDGFIAEYHSLATMLAIDHYLCQNIQLFNEKIYITGTLAFPKDSPLTSLMSLALGELKSENAYVVSQEKWLSIVGTCLGPELTANAFTLEYAGGMVVMVAVILLISLVVLSAETLYSKVRVSRSSIFEINPLG